MSNTTTTESTGHYAEVNGLRLYYELHGAGTPLVLLHGGLQTIDLAFGALLPTLAREHRVIAVELQGHGHTADTDRDLAFGSMAEDIVALLDHLGIERADVFGFSLGGLVSLELAVRHHQRFGKVVLGSTHYRTDGYHPEIGDPSRPDVSSKLPTAEDFQQMTDAYRATAPDPEHFGEFAARCTTLVHSMPGWTEDELRSIGAEVMLVIGDNDFVRVEHAARMHELIPGSRLAVLPGTTHMNVVQRVDLILPVLRSFLG